MQQQIAASSTNPVAQQQLQQNMNTIIQQWQAAQV
jgi:hypothetical protein